MDIDTGWSEVNSLQFIEFGDAVTPSRAEHLRLLASLVPADTDDEFLAVDMACGAGSLSETLLRHYPRCKVLALDGSPAMLESARKRLTSFGDRVEYRQFDLRHTDWLDLPQKPRLFASSLAIHHLDGNEKRQLFGCLACALEPGGALLIVDIIEPVNEHAWQAYGDAWDTVARGQSEAAGNPQFYQEFLAQEWNHYRFPDLEFDKPSRLYEQLRWLTEAGFGAVDCFWLRAGHALYGGYR